jgi:hypothetical protein
MIMKVTLQEKFLILHILKKKTSDDVFIFDLQYEFSSINVKKQPFNNAHKYQKDKTTKKHCFYLCKSQKNVDTNTVRV